MCHLLIFIQFIRTKKKKKIPLKTDLCTILSLKKNSKM